MLDPQIKGLLDITYPLFLFILSPRNTICQTFFKVCVKKGEQCVIYELYCDYETLKK